MTIRQLFAVVACIGLSPIVGRCDSRQLSREQVFAVLQSGFAGTPLKDIHFSPNQIKLPAGRILFRHGAEIRLTRFWVDRHARAIDVALKCKQSACIPFYVTLVEVDAPETVKDKGTFTIGESWEGTEAASNGERSKPALRQGEIASLLFQRNGVRLSVPVVCLQQGVPGHLIRTRIVGTNRIAVAKVVGLGRVSAVATESQQR